MEVDVFDPLVNESPELPLNINLLNKMPNKKYSGAVLAVNHDAFEEITISTLKKNLEDALVMDIKGKYATSDVDFKL